MGKSTVASHLRRLGFAIFDSDLAVHELYSRGGAAGKDRGNAGRSDRLFAAS